MKLGYRARYVERGKKRRGEGQREECVREDRRDKENKGKRKAEESYILILLLPLLVENSSEK